jgi:adenylate kinase
LRHDVLVKKLLGRRVCPRCSHAYNIADVHDGEYQMPAIPPVKDSNMCDDCEVPLV